jgi:hypothetical protein
MNTIKAAPDQKLPFTAEDWDSLRFLLQNSLMAKTHMCKLAQSMGETWPMREKEETPEKYIDHTLDELAEMPEFYGKGNRLSLLYSILKETQSLDDPFTEMISHIDKIIEQENDALLGLQRYEIPEDFPVELANFSEDTMNLCRVEQFETIGEFVQFAQRSAKSTVISGDYRLFLNALMHQDVQTICRFLPIREGQPGIYLTEAIAMIARHLSNEQAASLLAAYKIPTTNPNWNIRAVLTKPQTLDLIEELKTRVNKFFKLMPEQAQQLRYTVLSKEGSNNSCFVTLADPHTEALSLAISMAALDVKPRFKGLIGRLVK